MKADERMHRALSAPSEFVDELSAAAYDVALRYAADRAWLELQLELWHVLSDAAKAWMLDVNLSTASVAVISRRRTLSSSS
jgi:hypothetical protein